MRRMPERGHWEDMTARRRTPAALRTRKGRGVRERLSTRSRAAIGIGATALSAMLLAACATPGGDGGVPGAVPTGIPSPSVTIAAGSSGPSQPDPFIVVYDGTQLNLRATTYCYGNVCADGVDENPPSVGSPDELLVRLTETGFTELGASQFGGGGDVCRGRGVEATAVDLGGGWWSVRAAGPADEYRIVLFARGPAGDMAAELMWTTTVDAPLPEPTASLTVVVDHDGEPDSYGVELQVHDLSSSPDEFAATITATAANGASHTFAATSSHDCHGEGALFFDGPTADGMRAAGLGDFPFAYRVELTLDGVVYTGTGTYPDDLTADNSLAVPLTFTPALP